MTKTLGPFKLAVQPGSFNPAETIVMLGQNGTGKTTMIKMLAGLMPPDTGAEDLPKLSISYKPQTIAPKFDGNVELLFNQKLKGAWQAPLFKSEIILPLNIGPLLDQEVQNLSGGELQRVAIVLALAKPCDIYLIDEPSAYLDSEQRVIASKVMKRWIMSSKRAAFIVEHDFIMATYMADKVIVFDGEPAKETHCTSPETLVTGMNRFLKLMDITFRRDPTNYRPRINKHESQKDQEQKKAGNYFLMEETEEQSRKRLEKQRADDAEFYETQRKQAEEALAEKAEVQEKKSKKKQKQEEVKEEVKEEVVAPKESKKSKKKAKEDDEWEDDDEE